MSQSPRGPQFSARQILDSIAGAGYATFENETPYDLNIFGVRTADTTVNRFNDWVGCVYRDENLVWNCRSWRATTDPGLYWLENPGNVNGTAILVPGQYRNTYMIDKHNNSYYALCQRAGDVLVWRDNDRDGELDYSGPTYSDARGINIHHASSSGTSTQVNKWSAGCQVIANIADFNRFMTIARKQQEYHPGWTKYTYTLLTEDQIIQP